MTNDEFDDLSHIVNYNSVLTTYKGILIIH